MTVDTSRTHTAADYDVIIAGGGLAGLTLALQLQRDYPDLRTLVLERQQHPLPQAAHKVGESTVEIGAYYLAEIAGLREHLEEQHLRKFGLRFFFSHGASRIDQVAELGATRQLATPSYQVDRGILENYMGQECQRRGIDFREGCMLRRCDLGENGDSHRVVWTHEGQSAQATTRWLVDASGRRGLLKQQLGLARDNEHDAHAVWFRMDTRIKIDELCNDPAWRRQCTPPDRWLSTNHLTGPGYWVWLIPLASGAHSIGIVADSRMHALDDMRDFDLVMRWLQLNQPSLAAALEPVREKLLDFRFLRNYSYSATQLFSADRWALTGEAGTFLDPFYSPGTDFIAIANTYITALIGRDRAGQPLAPWARIYQDLFFSFYESTLDLFKGQYPLFGNARVMTQKVTWDYAYYWAILCPLVFQGRLTDIDLLGKMREEFRAATALNQRMQRLLADWHRSLGNAASTAGPGLIDQIRLPWLVELNRQMGKRLDPTLLERQLHDNIRLLRSLAAAISQHARVDAPHLEILETKEPDLPILDTE
ncbi:MAG TPA: tryptophan 7-halogenase [Oleiagrimonas sp.]|nr:tryptophan 7-halogenase [Oleiagrimonas sp.]